MDYGNWSKVEDCWEELLDENIADIVAAIYWDYESTSLGKRYEDWVRSNDDLEEDDDYTETEESVPGRKNSEEAKKA